jgi:hypothetical protein
MVSYETKDGKIVVRLSRKIVGHIRKSKGGGYHYAPKGGGWGETFPTVAEVKASIEGR